MRTKVLMVLGLVVAAGLAGGSLLRQVPLAEAQTSCAENPVNVQFRPWTGTEGTWLEGAGFAPTQGSYIDVNCFSKNGAQLLSGGKLTATRTYGGVTTNISVSTWAREIRQYQVAQPGVYTFTCRNTAGSCTNSDSFTVTGVPTGSPSPTPSPTPASATPVCNGISINGGVTPTVGQRVKFVCQGPANTSTVFFSHRHSATDPLVQLTTEAGNLSTELEITPYTQVQCNPCVGTTCATAANVNANCTFTYNPAPASPTPTPGTQSKADLNQDGKVDILDYQIFLSEYLKFVRQ